MIRSPMRHAEDKEAQVEGQELVGQRPIRTQVTQDAHRDKQGQGKLG